MVGGELREETHKVQLAAMNEEVDDGKGILLLLLIDTSWLSPISKDSSG